MTEALLSRGRLLVALIAGVVFGLGLGVSGMTQPTKVLGFLDLAGAWDPSLAFVMAGAIGVHLVGTRVARRRKAPVLGGAFSWPAKTEVDRALVVGAAIFGVGWGLGGFCPGPALCSAASGNGGAAAFVVAMAVGILVRAAKR